MVLVIANYSGQLSPQYHPLLNFPLILDYLSNEVLQLLFIIFGISLNLFTINRSLVFGFNIIEQMALDGFLPKPFRKSSTLGSGYLFTIVGIAGVSALLIQCVTPYIIIGLASITFLWTAAISHLPDLVRPVSHLPNHRKPRLPFHPLFPGITILLGILLPLSLDSLTQLILGIWVCLGLIYFLLFGRKKMLAVRRQETVLSPTSADEKEIETGFRVMVSIANPQRAAGLLQIGHKISQARGGSLRVLKIFLTNTTTPEYRKSRDAQSEWETLSKLVIQELGENHPAKTLVRLAPSAAAGIIETIGEEKIDLLIIGWEGENQPDEFFKDPVISPIMQNAPCEIAILHGDLPPNLDRLLVTTAGGPYAPLGLSIAEDLVSSHGKISLIHFNDNAQAPSSQNQAKENLQSTLQFAKKINIIEGKVVPTNHLRDDILDEAQKSELLLMGAAKSSGIFESPFFGGLPIEVAHQSKQPTLVTRSYEKHRYAWLQRIWMGLTDRLPHLHPEERLGVIQAMQRAAVPNVDFFILIFLAAGIASLGLLLNSTAVIIGAMLVAPLMSPILAMSMSIVLGNLRMLRLAAEATIKGIVLAIIIGVLMTLISPISETTSEIIARTSPNILDLIVALLSGMAAGYAVSRKEVSSALPGVAIAAALVPPLCVVGYGFGIANLQIALGALLLFTTNLITIILAATFIFLALGISPSHSERKELLRGIRVTGILLIFVFLTLGYLTVQNIQEQREEAIIREIFYSETYSHAIQVTELDIEHIGNQVIISVTLLDLQGNQLTTNQITSLKNAIDVAIGSNVTFRITTLPATYNITNLTNVERESQLTDAFIIEIQKHPVQIISAESHYLDYRRGFIVNAEIYAIYPNTLSDSLLARTQARLSERMGLPVSFNLKILQGEQIKLQATPFFP